jgi:hypothetical protein
MTRIKLRLKNIRKGRTVQRWNMNALEAKKGTFQNVLEKEKNKVTEGKVGDIEKKWTTIKETVLKGAEQVFGFQKGKRAKKPWITEMMLQKMDERRRWKRINTVEGRIQYKRLNNELRRETEKAREGWWESRCDELVEYDNRGRSDLLYYEVGRLTKTRSETGKRNTAINDKKGKLVTELDEVKMRWKEYIEDLYGKDNKPTFEKLQLEEEEQVESDELGPNLLSEEICVAIKELKSGKAAGVDGIPTEFLKLLDEGTLTSLIELCKEIYEKGIWPEDFTKVVMIPIPKKNNAVECGDHRTISLVSHASKIMLKVLTRRLEAKIESMISRTQFGFRRGCGTREAIGVLRTLCERSLEHDNDVFICFVDFEKAFDRVDWIKLLQILKNVGVDWRDRRLIANLYVHQKAVVRVGNETSEESEIGRGVRQGCCMSPLLFNIYIEAVMVEAMEGVEEGIKVNGKTLNDVRFADDQGMVAGSEEGLQTLIDRLSVTAERYGMRINAKKTKVMRVSRKTGGKLNITINGNMIEQVQSFKYLGSTMTEDGRCESEVKIRIALAKEAFSKRKELLTKKFKKRVKKKLVKTLVWSVLLYGCETWTLKASEISRIEAAEMWMWRRMEKISYLDRITNLEVLSRIGEERHLLDMVRNRKKKWIGHIVRGDGVLKEVMEGRMEGKKTRGRPRTGMLTELIRGSYGKMKRMAENREEWRCWMPWTSGETCLTGNPAEH